MTSIKESVKTYLLEELNLPLKADELSDDTPLLSSRLIVLVGQQRRRQQHWENVAALGETPHFNRPNRFTANTASPQLVTQLMLVRRNKHCH